MKKCLAPYGGSGESHGKAHSGGASGHGAPDEFRLDVGASPDGSSVRFSIVKLSDQSNRFVDLKPEQARRIAETILRNLGKL